MATQVVRDPAEAPAEPRGEPCDVCGAPTLELHCKVICKRCGYVRDCGDP